MPKRIYFPFPFSALHSSFSHATIHSQFFTWSLRHMRGPFVPLGVDGLSKQIPHTGWLIKDSLTCASVPLTQNPSTIHLGFKVTLGCLEYLSPDLQVINLPLEPLFYACAPLCQFEGLLTPQDIYSPALHVGPHTAGQTSSHIFKAALYWHS